MKTRIVLTLVAAAAFAGCGGSSSESSTIVAAFYPLAYAAEQVAATERTSQFDPAGLEPHDLELSGSDIRTIADARLVLYLGRVPARSGAGSRLGVGACRRSARATAVERPARLARSSSGTPCSPSGSGRSSACRSGAEPSQRSCACSTASSAQASPAASGDEIVTSHAAFAYFADRYGLTQIAITGSPRRAEPTPRDLEESCARYAHARATTVFFEPLVSPRLAETVAREVGVKTAVLNPLEGLSDEEIAAGEDYFSVMRENLAALRKALGCR